jgi:hypothetical protein
LISHCRLDFPDVELIGTTLSRQKEKIGDFAATDEVTRRRGYLIDGDDFLPYPFADKLPDSHAPQAEASVGEQTVKAELVETSIGWRPACEGATIDVISEGAKIQSVRAFAAHSLVFREWTIHYVDGTAFSAEYRERERGKIKEGDRAGEDSGENPIKRLMVFKAVAGKFNIADKELADDLADVLSRVTLPPSRMLR